MRGLVRIPYGGSVHMASQQSSFHTQVATSLATASPGLPLLLLPLLLLLLLASWALLMSAQPVDRSLESVTSWYGQSQSRVE